MADLVVNNVALDGDKLDRIIRVIDHVGGLSAKVEDIIRLASDPKNPLHPLFEWDDRKAAVKFRVVQAERLLKTIRLYLEGADDSDPATALPPRLPARVKIGGAQPVVTSINTDEVMVKNALSQLNDWYLRHRNLKEKSPAITRAIQAIEDILTQ